MILCTHNCFSRKTCLGLTTAMAGFGTSEVDDDFFQYEGVLRAAEFLLWLPRQVARGDEGGLGAENSI